MKRVKFKPIFYLGLSLFTLGIWGDDLFNINNQTISYGLIIVGIIGMAMMIKGKTIYEKMD